MNSTTHPYIIHYWNGSRWVYLTQVKKFWKPRRYTSKAAAQKAIAGFKKDAPYTFQFRVLKAS